jgi:glycine cleavage system H protein
MANVPADLKYTAEHEWVRRDGDLYVIGITHYAQDTLGDVVYIELKEVGETIKEGRPFGVVESVKAASDLYAPISGEIVEVNTPLFDTPEVVNTDPYGEAWMVKIRASDESEADKLLDASAYQQMIES